MQKNIETQEKSNMQNSQQISTYAKQNDALVEELNRLYEENKALKRNQTEQDT